MPERLKVWQILFLVFPLLIWMAYSSYVDFTHLEEEGGVLYVGKTTKLLYTLGGKWAVVGFPIVAIGVWGYAIWKTLAMSKKADALRAQAEHQEDITRNTKDAPISTSPRPAASRPPVRPAAAPTAATELPPRPRSPSNPPPASSRPPIARAPSGPITPLTAAAPPAQPRTDDVPPDPSGPRFLR
jgi:hypothetical protein